MAQRPTDTSLPVSLFTIAVLSFTLQELLLLYKKVPVTVLLTALSFFSSMCKEKCISIHMLCSTCMLRHVHNEILEPFAFSYAGTFKYSPFP